MLKKTRLLVQKEQHKFALVCARGLGDALLSMILARNLSLSGIQVTTFSSILCELKDWFPGYQILPYPSSEQCQAIFSLFETVIAADHACISENHNFKNHLLILKEDKFDKTKTMVKNLQAVCKHTLGLPFFSSDNGIAPPSSLQWRAHPNRIVLHPTSSDTNKNWPAEKFILLAQELKNKGFDPYFCVSPKEEPDWKGLVPSDQLPHFPTVSNLARFVYESGFLIGNDSGVGHLASILHIPTLSLFARKSYSLLWRPGWGPGMVATPPNILLGSRMKQKYWKQLLSVEHVIKQFEKLERSVDTQTR